MSIEVLNEYLMREAMSQPQCDKELKEARVLISKVVSAKGNSLREKAENAKIDYADFMSAQRLVGSKY